MEYWFELKKFDQIYSHLLMILITQMNIGGYISKIQEVIDGGKIMSRHKFKLLDICDKYQELTS